MKQVIILCQLLLIVVLAEGQQTTLVRKGEGVFPSVSKQGFYFIEGGMELKDQPFVATLRASVTGKLFGVIDFTNMYRRLEKKARGLGANAFVVRDHSYDEAAGRASVTMDVYFLSAAALVQNKGARVKNQVFVFPQFPDQKKVFKCEVNKVSISLRYGQYLKADPGTGGVICLRKGGLTGEERCIQGRAEGPSVYFTAAGAGFRMPGTITTGQLDLINEDVGELLMNVFFTEAVEFRAERK